VRTAVVVRSMAFVSGLIRSTVTEAPKRASAVEMTMSPPIR
jgi:hypothetical protein